MLQEVTKLDIQVISFLITIIFIEPPIITQPLTKVVEASVGTDIRLACDCTRCEPLTAYSWSIASEHLTASLTPNQTISQNLQLDIERPWLANNRSRNYAAFHLNISNVTEANEGSYECRLSNEHSNEATASVAVFVRVVMPPSIQDLTLLNPELLSNENGTLIVMRGSKATMVCRTRGRPKPSLQWLKDGKPLEKDKR